MDMLLYFTIYTCTTDHHAFTRGTKPKERKNVHSSVPFWDEIIADWSLSNIIKSTKVQTLGAIRGRKAEHALYASLRKRTC